MKVKFLGTGAAEGVPALFCNCEHCRLARARGGREIHARAQVVYDGELSVDFPPDVYFHALNGKVDLSAIKYLLVTHSHMDHFCAQNLVLRGYKYAHGMTSPTLDIYANEEVISIFREDTRRELKPDVGESISLHPMGAFEEAKFGDWSVHSLLARHTSQEPLLFLLEKGGKRALHLADTGALPDATVDYLAALGVRADLIVMDCTFLFGKTPPEARHMGLDENARTLARLAAIGVSDERTKVVITHFSHNSSPSAEELSRAEREYGYIAAYDGLELEL